MERSGFIPLIKRWWPFLLLGTVVAAVAANVFASRLPPTYQAEVKLLTGPINTDLGTLRASGELSRTYSELAASGPLLLATAKQVGVTQDTELLKESVQATSNEVTRIISIRFDHEDPGKAAQFANALAARLSRLTRETPPEVTEAIDTLMRHREIASLPEETQDGVRDAAVRTFGQPFAGRLKVVDPAEIPDKPIAPRVTFTTVLGGIAGLLLVGVVVLLREYTRETMDDQALAELAPVPVLGSVDSLTRMRPGEPLVVESAPSSRAADDYRLLATKIGFSADEAGVRSLLVVGAEDERGSGSLAANLAAVLAERDIRVTLLDASGEITKLLGLEGLPGYANLVEDGGLLAAKNGFADLLVARNDALEIVPSGNVDGPGLLELDRAEHILERLLTQTDVVLVNAGPVDRSPSALQWSRATNGTLLVVRSGKTSREDFTHAVESLALVGANLVGIVVREGRRLLPAR